MHQESVGTSYFTSVCFIDACNKTFSSVKGRACCLLFLRNTHADAGDPVNAHLCECKVTQL
jgi:hypothetical protein